MNVEITLKRENILSIVETNCPDAEHYFKVKSP